MKKHILGLAIFSFIVGSFVSIWAVAGYLTQSIPPVPKVESMNIPVYKYEGRKHCRMKSERVSYDVKSSYYFADENVVVSTLKLRWDGYGAPPEMVSVMPKLFTSDKRVVISGSGTHFRDIFANGPEAEVTVRTYPAGASSKLLNENFYADFRLTADADADFDSRFGSSSPQPVVVVHGNSSLLDR
jgi:hypothetical protein